MKNVSVILSFIFPLAILVSTSLLILNSVSPQSAETQIVSILISTLLYFLFSRLDYSLYLFSPWPWYVSANFILLLTYILGSAQRGSIRWLNLFGVSLQTSEVAKVLLVLFFALYLTRQPLIKSGQLFRYLGLLALPVLLIYLQPDLGSAILITILGLSSLVAGGVSFKLLLRTGFILLVLTPVLFLTLKEYQRERLISFFQPNHDPLGSGYNALQSQIAVGSGQLLGRGLGYGTQSHLRFLPERQTDFIFASTVEELGFVGGLILFSAYAGLIYALINAARRSNSDTGSLICLNTLVLILVQVFVNIGMNMGLLPVTGITLPFVSDGGSSLLAFSVLIGICTSVARHHTTHPAYFEIR